VSNLSFEPDPLDFDTPQGKAIGSGGPLPGELNSR